jgi:hypothetical protein
VLPREEVVLLAKRLTEEAKAAELGIARITEVFSSHGVSLRPYFTVELKLSGIKFETVCSAYDRSKLTYSIIVGKNSLAKFLIDPTK